MSIDTCKECGDLVDTDLDPDSYVEIDVKNGGKDYKCVCVPCRDDIADGEEAARQFQKENFAAIKARFEGAR